MAFLVCAVCMTLLVPRVSSVDGFGGEVQFSPSDYLNNDVSLFLGIEVYSRLYATKQTDPDSGDEVLDGIAEVFEDADVDRSGDLDEQELTALLGKNKFSLLSKDLIENFHELDINNDNQLSWREYFTQSFSNDFVNTVDRGFVDIESMQGGNVEYEAFYAYYKFQRFLAADVDESDSLTQSEYVMFMKPKEFQNMREIYFDEVMQDINVDEDRDHVSEKEFISSVQAEFLLMRPDDSPSPLTYVQQELERFHKLDVDNNNKLDRNETFEWIFGSVRTDHGHLVEEELEKYLRICDEDKNGKLDFTEVVQQSEFIYSGIDPAETKTFTDYMARLHISGDEEGIASYFTPEAIQKLEEQYSDDTDEFQGIPGYIPSNIVNSEDDAFLGYEPEFDPDVIKWKWGFINPGMTRISRGYTLYEYLKEVRQRNGIVG